MWVGLVFLAFTAVQVNDPDALPWLVIYGGTSLLSLQSAVQRIHPIIGSYWLLVCLLSTLPQLQALGASDPSTFTKFSMVNLQEEQAREVLGLLLATSWTAALCCRLENGEADRTRR